MRGSRNSDVAAAEFATHSRHMQVGRQALRTLVWLRPLLLLQARLWMPHPRSVKIWLSSHSAAARQRHRALCATGGTLGLGRRVKRGGAARSRVPGTPRCHSHPHPRPAPCLPPRSVRARKDWLAIPQVSSSEEIGFSSLDALSHMFAQIRMHVDLQRSGGVCFHSSSVVGLRRRHRRLSWRGGRPLPDDGRRTTDDGGRR